MINAVKQFLGRIWAGKPLTDANPYWIGNQSTAGVEVNRQTAMSLSSVFAAVNLLSRLLASLPVHTYRTYGREKERAITLPAYRILHSSPNSEMTAFTFRAALEWHRLLCGNAYSEIVWAGNGKPAALWPIEAWRVKPRRKADGALYYEVDGERVVAPEDMIHVPLMTTDGVTGLSFLDYALDSLGFGLAAQEFAAAWFGNGARPGSILKHPGNPSPEARKEQRRAWEERHRGSGKAGGTAVLWGGWEWIGTDGQVDPAKAQLLESRRFSTEEVSRWLGIPPHLLYDLTRSTFSNIEQQNLDFLVYSFGPILTSYEQEFDRKLLMPPSVYCKHSVNGLLRGDSASRSAFYREMFHIGVLSVNEIRDLEDLNPVVGGDLHFAPLNMAPLDQMAQPNEPQPTAEPTTEPAQAPTETPQPSPEAPAVPTLSPALVSDTLARLARVEAQAVRRAAEKPGKFLTWMESWYSGHRLRLTEALLPLLPDTAAQVANQWCDQSSESLLALTEVTTPANFKEAAESLVTRWAARVESETRIIVQGGK